MGNCLNTASKRHHHGDMLPEEEESLSEMRRISQLLRDDHDVEEEQEASPAAAVVAAEGLKVKVVLTRGELQWLMAQLKSGEQRLEDVLQHMQAVSGGGGAAHGADKAGWRPRLESIVECQETTDHNNSLS